MKLRNSVEDAFLGTRPTYVENNLFDNNVRYKHIYTNDYIFELRDDEGVVYLKRKDQPDSDYEWWFNQIPISELPFEVRKFIEDNSEEEQ